MSRALRLLLAVALLAFPSCSDDEPEARRSPATSTMSSTSSTSAVATPESSDTTAATAAPTTAARRPAATAAPRTRPPATTAPTPASPPKLALQSIGQLNQPLAMANRGGELYVGEKVGRVKRHAGGAWTVALDIAGDVSTGGEQGLLGLAFSPDGARAYVNYTDRAGDTHVVEYAVRGDGAFEAGSRRELLSVDQPYANHNGGHLVIGHDSKLYIALGDGGSGGDPHGNAQNLGTLLGKLLRIDPTPSATAAYTVPSDNPFAGRAGARSEIWAYGLRNPWRFTFDRDTRDLWVADVGQGSREEVNRVAGSSRGGENYGWKIFEGTQRFRDGETPRDYVGPVHEYATRSGGCAVTGGYVYRGSAIAQLRGFYLFGDFCRGRVLALRSESPGSSIDTGLEVGSLASFGEDAQGELYVLSLQGDVSKIVGG